MTTAAPAPVAPGPKGAPPRTAPRPAKRHPSDQRDRESSDPVANGGPALAFLAVLQGVPKTVAPTPDHGSSTIPAASAKTGPATGPVVAPALPSGQRATAAGSIGARGTSRPATTHASTPEAGSETSPAGAGAPNRPSAAPAATPGQRATAIPNPLAVAAGGEPPGARSRGTGTTSTDPKPTAPSSLGAVARTGVPAATAIAGLGGAATGQGQAHTASGERAPSGSSAHPVRPVPPRPSDPSNGTSAATRGPTGPIAPGVAGVAAWDRTTSPDHTSGDGKKAVTGSGGLLGTGTPRSAAGVTPNPAAGPIPPSGGNAPSDLTQTVPAQVIQQLIEQPPRPNTTVVLRLDPPMLGSVVLRVVAGGGNRIRLHFGVDDPSVGDALTGGLARLESALRAQGLSPEGLSVGLNNTQLGGGPAGQSGQESPRSLAGPRDRGTTIGIQPSSEPVSVARTNGGRYIDYLL